MNTEIVLKMETRFLVYEEDLGSILELSSKSHVLIFQRKSV